MQCLHSISLSSLIMSLIASSLRILGGLAVAAHPGSIGSIGGRWCNRSHLPRFQGCAVESPWLTLFDGAEHMISIVWCRPSMFRFSNLHTNPLTFERWCLLVGWAQVVHISTDEWCLPHPGPKQRGCELLRCSTLAARWTKPSGDSGHLFYFTDLFWRQCFVLPSFLLYSYSMCFWCVLLCKGKNAGFNVQRLKEKIGDKSNASSEVEYRNAWGVMIGEPGRGVRTIVTQPILGSVFLCSKPLLVDDYRAQYIGDYHTALWAFLLTKCFSFFSRVCSPPSTKASGCGNSPLNFTNMILQHQTRSVVASILSDFMFFFFPIVAALCMYIAHVSSCIPFFTLIPGGWDGGPHALGLCHRQLGPNAIECPAGLPSCDLAARGSADNGMAAGLSLKQWH